MLKKTKVIFLFFLSYVSINSFAEGRIDGFGVVMFKGTMYGEIMTDRSISFNFKKDELDPETGSLVETGNAVLKIHQDAGDTKRNIIFKFKIKCVKETENNSVVLSGTIEKAKFGTWKRLGMIPDKDMKKYRDDDYVGGMFLFAVKDDDVKGDSSTHSFVFSNERTEDPATLCKTVNDDEENINRWRWITENEYNKMKANITIKKKNR